MKTSQLGSENFPIEKPAPGVGHDEGVCFSCRYSGVLFFINFHEVNGLRITAKLSKGKKVLPTETKKIGEDVIVYVK